LATLWGYHYQRKGENASKKKRTGMLEGKDSNNEKKGIDRQLLITSKGGLQRYPFRERKGSETGKKFWEKKYGNIASRSEL